MASSDTTKPSIASGRTGDQLPSTSLGLPFGPYSPARWAGEYLYISGQVGVDPSSSGSAAADIDGQARQALQNLQHIVREHGLELSDVVKTTLFLRSIDDFAAANRVYGEYFRPPRPARSCVAVAELPRVAGATAILVEIEAVAYQARRPSGRAKS